MQGSSNKKNDKCNKLGFGYFARDSPDREKQKSDETLIEDQLNLNSEDDNEDEERGNSE